MRLDWHFIFNICRDKQDYFSKYDEKSKMFEIHPQYCFVTEIVRPQYNYLQVGALRHGAEG